MAKRAIVLVLDGCGAGVAPDAAEFGNLDQPNTLRHVSEAVSGLSAPNLAATGFFAVAGVPFQGDVSGNARRLQPESKGGKDSVTGHWEMMGIVLDQPFPTYPNGFPADLLAEFSRRTGRNIIGNRAASGTAIINELGPNHVQTGDLIVYTSADSVFQIGAHEAVVPIETLYEYGQIARELTEAQRVIVRPFVGEAGNFQRTDRRKDFPLSPPKNYVDVHGDVLGIGVVPELFGGRGFRSGPRTQSNAEHAKALLIALESDATFIFANFEDFDMRFGHRNDPVGFARCLQEFDQFFVELQGHLTPEDLLILTADHGNDPTTPSTDHDREYVPAVQIGANLSAGLYPDERGFHQISKWVAAHLNG